ncbi:unnamed protein product [Ascophyllum nodosum]
MLCTSARRLLPRASASIHRGLAMPGKLSLQLPQVSTQAAPGTASRRTCADIKDRGLRRRASTEAVPEATGLTLDVDERAPRVKHRIPQRRASHLLNELLTEQKNGKRCQAPDMKVGDAIQVTMYTNKKAARTSQFRGVLIRKVNKGVDSTILLRDVINGNPVETHIPLYSPLVQSIEVLETAFIYQGKLKGKRVRQARIYYIRNLDHKYYRITGGGGSA